MRVLVTGAAGMLGSEVCRSLQDSHEVWGMLHRCQPKWPHPSFVTADLTDSTSLSQAFQRAQPDWVVHTAAWADVDACEREQERAMAINADGTRFLARLCEDRRAGLLYISTDYVFDGAKGTPYMEEDTPNPINHYGRTKFLAEQAVQECASRHALVRSAWLYGEFGPNFVTWLREGLEQGIPRPVVTDQTGSPTCCRDLAEAIGRLLEAEGQGIYHLVNEGCISRYGQAQQIAAHLGVDMSLLTPVLFEELGRPAPRPADTALTGERYFETTGQRMRGWKESLTAYLDQMSEVDDAT